MMEMNVEIIDGCISCGNCVEICPEVFGFDNEEIAEVIGSPEGNEEAVQEAANSCPVTVIVVQ
jgi:ferredoxin